MLTKQTIELAVAAALAEDAPWGDITAGNVLQAGAVATAQLESRAAGVFAGGEVLRAAFSLSDERIVVEKLLDDGTRVGAGESVAIIRGPARGMLTGERVALNFAQRMSGIATATARFVAAVEGTGARIVDTRKTAPGLRAFDKAAVVAGGGHSHRWGLSDAVMLKDNHLAVLRSEGEPLANALRALRGRLGHTVHIEVEIDGLDQLDEVLAGGADTIMLDNFDVKDLRTAVARIGGRAITEASGGVDLSSVRSIAETGVDIISVGALTHSVVALDLGLDLVIEDARR